MMNIKIGPNDFNLGYYGALIVEGRPCTGKTEFLKRVIGQLTSFYQPHELHLIIADTGSIEIPDVNAYKHSEIPRIFDSQGFYRRLLPIIERHIENGWSPETKILIVWDEFLSFSSECWNRRHFERDVAALIDKCQNLDSNVFFLISSQMITTDSWLRDFPMLKLLSIGDGILCVDGDKLAVSLKETVRL